jgi:hypothetical protein
MIEQEGEAEAEEKEEKEAFVMMNGEEVVTVQEDGYAGERNQMAHNHIPELALDVELDGIDCALDSRAEIYSPICRFDSS